MIRALATEGWADKNVQTKCFSRNLTSITLQRVGESDEVAAESPQNELTKLVCVIYIHE